MLDDKIRQFYQGLSTQRILIYTTDYVLDEVLTLLFRREVLMKPFVSSKASSPHRNRVTL